ncbi:MAG: hypothetical protein AAGC67_18515 [Myxococcota bacterium]
MRLSLALTAALTTLLGATLAHAALDITSPQIAGVTTTPGSTVTIDIVVSTSPGPEALALGLRAADYDPLILTQGTATVVPSSIFNFSPTVMFGGLSNVASGVEEPPGGVRPGTSINLFQGVSTTPAAGAGPDSFQIQFVAGDEGTTTINIGALSTYADAYGGGDGVANNISIDVTVPEPASMLSAVAALGAVVGVVGVRRRF